MSLPRSPDWRELAASLLADDLRARDEAIARLAEDPVAAWRAVATCLCRAAADLRALVPAAAAIRGLASTLAGEPALLEQAIGFARPRAVVFPGALADLAAAAAAPPRPPAEPAEPAVPGAPAEPLGTDDFGTDDFKRLDRACGWLERQLDRALATDGAVLPAYKRIGELAHAGEVLARAPDPVLAATGRRWLERGWRALDEGRGIAAAIEAAPRNVLAATVVPAFVRADPAWAAAIRERVAGAVARQLGAAMLAPAEWVYLVPSLDALGLAPPGPARGAAAGAAVLGTRPPPWRLALDHVYQLAHEVFYATAWGRDRALADADRAYLGRWLAVLAVVYAEDADALAELLAAACCADAPASPRSWQDLARAQRDDGSLAAPARPGLAPHHPTLVAIVAWGLRASTGTRGVPSP